MPGCLAASSVCPAPRSIAAPEIMLACQHYGIAIDVWAVGCIYAELLGTKPLFPGASLRLRPFPCIACCRFAST